VVSPNIFWARREPEYAGREPRLKAVIHPQFGGMIKKFDEMTKNMNRSLRDDIEEGRLVPSDLVASLARQVAQALASPPVRPLGLLARMRRECFSPREGVVSQSLWPFRLFARCHRMDRGALMGSAAIATCTCARQLAFEGAHHDGASQHRHSHACRPGTTAAV